MIKKVIYTLILLALANTINSQVARNLTAKKVVQSTPKKDSLKKYYHKLLNDKSLLSRGKQTIYKGKNLEAIQFPVGGIGSGCIQFNGNAEPRYWQIFNNMTYDHIPNSFFAISYKNGNKVVSRALQTKEVNGFTPLKEVEVTSQLPFINYKFRDDIPFDIDMEVYNPFIPTDLKNSEIPAVFYTFTIKNRSETTQEINLLASQQNAIGFTKVKKITDGDSFAERFDISLNRKLINENKSAYYDKNYNYIEKNNQAVKLIMKGSYPKNDEHFGEMALMIIDDNISSQKTFGSASWKADNKSLRNILKKGKTKTKKSKKGKTYTGVLGESITLKPGEERKINMILAWYFPNGKNGGHVDRWDSWGKGKWEGKGNMYANYWNNIEELSEYIIENHSFLSKTSKQFSESFYKTNLPIWLNERLANQLNVLNSRTIFHDKNGYVGLWEGCGSGDGSCAGNCNHVWHYAQAHARLFPELGRQIKNQSFGYIKENGQIPYRQPNGSPAFDGQCGDILGAYREYLLSEDDKWLKSQFNAIKKAIKYLIDSHDSDEDGILTGKMHTTYDCSMSGNPSFLSSLYLATLKAGIKIANVCNDNDFSNYLNKIALKSSQYQNSQLWNGEYFIQTPDTLHRASDYINGCHSDQILGQWWSELNELENLYPEYRISSSINSVLKYNFKSTLKFYKQNPREFAKPEEAAFVVTTWPNNDRPTGAPGYSDEIWPAYEYTIGSMLLRRGFHREAFMVLKSGVNRYDGKLRKNYKGAWGNFGFSGNPFGDDECGQFYSRSLSCWAVLMAAQGFHYNGPQKHISFNPVWKSENHCSFFSTAKAWGNFYQQRDSNSQVNKLEIHYGNLSLNTISLNYLDKAKSVDVFINNKAINSEFTQNNNQLIIKLNNINLVKGDMIKIVIK